MSLHWTLIAGFLYAEIAALILLILPIFSPRRWSKLFKSKFLKAVEKQLIYYFYVLVAILVLFFLDAIRETRKYADVQEALDHGTLSQLDSKMQTHMRLFRAQRNFYISGFALFLCLVIKKMVVLINGFADLETSGSGGSQAKESERILNLEKELQDTKKELSSAQKEVNSLSEKNKSLSDEYDKLTEDYSGMEKKLGLFQGVEDKKDN